jgi:hypothetical protein
MGKEVNDASRVKEAETFAIMQAWYVFVTGKLQQQKKRNKFWEELIAYFP